MTAVHVLKCKFKEITSDGSIIFHYGYRSGLFGSKLFEDKGRESSFTEEDCYEMIANGEPPYQRGALKFNEEIVKYNANESRRALTALADYRR